MVRAVCSLRKRVQLRLQQPLLSLPHFLTLLFLKSSWPSQSIPNPSQAQSTQQPASGSNPAPAASGSGSNNGAAQGSSSSQSSSAQPEPQETQHQKAAEQIKEQEKQRMAGIVPSFNVTYHSDAASMTAGQKIGLAFRSAIDPYTFGIAFIVAGIDETQGARHGDLAGVRKVTSNAPAPLISMPSTAP